MIDREDALSRLKSRLATENDPKIRQLIETVLDRLQPGFASAGGCGDRVTMTVTRKESTG